MEKKETEALTEGALCGEFYVGEGKKVRFSKGNLQFNAVQGTHKILWDREESPGTWRFAEHQWDVIGKDNKKISETYDGFIDLFGWATGGSHTDPWETSKKHEVYCFEDFGEDEDLDRDPEDKSVCTYDSGEDWGLYNAISNGGDTPGKWRTLTGGEWEYLFWHNRWTLGRIEGMLCFLFIPEGVEVPAKVFSETYDEESSGRRLPDYESNSFTEEQFKKYEELGVVALPCGGWRTGKKLECVGETGIYWSSSICDMEVAYTFCFGFDCHGDRFVDECDASDPLFSGCSVRLVQDV